MNSLDSQALHLNNVCLNLLSISFLYPSHQDSYMYTYKSTAIYVICEKCQSLLLFHNKKKLEILWVKLAKDTPVMDSCPGHNCFVLLLSIFHI